METQKIVVEIIVRQDGSIARPVDAILAAVLACRTCGRGDDDGVIDGLCRWCGWAEEDKASLRLADGQHKASLARVAETHRIAREEALRERQAERKKLEEKIDRLVVDRDNWRGLWQGLVTQQGVADHFATIAKASMDEVTKGLADINARNEARARFRAGLRGEAPLTGPGVHDPGDAG